MGKQHKSIEDLKFYLEVLRSEECMCGRYKRSKNAFCYRCYCRLPGHLQRDLYQEFRHGFEEAYDAACKFLEE